MSPLKVTAAVLIGGVSSSFCMAYLGSQASDSPYLAVSKRSYNGGFTFSDIPIFKSKGIIGKDIVHL